MYIRHWEGTNKKHTTFCNHYLYLSATIEMPPTDTKSKPHFVLVPLMAQGHMIPMIDLARLLASRGALVSFITTPVNASRMSTIIARIHQSNLPIDFVHLRFPTSEVGLPEGLENLDMITSRDLIVNFMDGLCLLTSPLIARLKNTDKPHPTCLISDNANYWTRDVAQEFRIPRIVFHGFGIFALTCIRTMRDHKIEETVHDENEPFVIPGLPDRIEITKTRIPGHSVRPNSERHRKAIAEAESTCDGVVVNSFDGLEPRYRESYEEAVGKKVWTVGPLSLSSEDASNRGNKAAISEDACIAWLDTRKAGSVVYVSFGSMARTSPAQIVELGEGLEASGCAFVWSVKGGERMVEVEEWMAEFEGRVRGRGMVIRGWAPQVVILSHWAVGGFMTHAGWNSTLESVSAGVPMVTWPHFAEQFLNEKLIVEVLRVGVAVGVKCPTNWGEEGDGVFVRKEGVEKAVRRLFGDEEMRRRAKAFGEKAKKAVEEGGSSYANIDRLIMQHVN